MQWIKRFWLWLILIGAFAPLAAQTEWNFSGYLSNLPVYQAGMKDFLGSGRSLALDLNRLRLRPTFYWGENTRIHLEYEIDALYQQNAGLLFALPQKTNRQRFNWRWQPVAKAHIMLIHYIDRLYLRRDFSFGNLTIGRQRVAWGTGRIWNPTDLFNPINPASFDKIEKDGADLVSAKIYLGNFTDLTLVFNPQDSWRQSNAGYRFRTNYREYDLSLVGGYFDKRLTLGGDFAGNLYDAGVRGEWLLSADKNNLRRNYIKWVAGIDYQFTSKLYALFEYHFNGQGARRRQDYDLLSLLNSSILNLNRRYLFTQVNLQLHPLVNTSLGYNANLVDGSGFVFAALTYSVKENTELGVGGQLFYGSDFSEYWFYPNSFFLRGEYYF